MAADPSILTTAVVDYIATMSKRELDELLATARDPEETTSEPGDTETDLGKIAGRMFGGAQ